MKSVNCPICNSVYYDILLKTKDYDSGRNELFTVVKCKKCDLIYINPQPSEKELGRYYVFDYYGNYGSIFHKIFSIINIFFMRNKSKEILNKKKGRILDIGCGDGSFLEYMKNKGWDAYGVETSGPGAKIAEKKLKKNIYNSELKRIKFQKGYFDVVTLWYVLEHVKNPDTMIKEVGRIIKNEGTLVLSLQNIKSLQAKIGGDKWFHFDIPRHLYHFSPETLNKLLKKNGFKVEKIRHLSFGYGFFGFLQTFLNMLGFIKFNFLYRLIKRNRQEKTIINFYFIYNLSLSILFALILMMPSILLTIAESFSGYGAMITIFCKKIS